MVHFTLTFKKLESTDRQLKLLDIWNQVLGGKAQFSGIFDINQYVKKGEKGENAILPDNIPLLQQWTLRQEETFSLLRTALGYSKLAPAEPYPSNAPGALAYRDGFQCE